MSLVELLTPRHMDYKIDQSGKEIEKLGNTQISYDPILSDDDEETSEAVAPCFSESNNNACKKNTVITGKHTELSTSEDSKTNNQFILVDSYMYDEDDEPNNSGSKRNKYTRDHEDLIVTYSSYEKDGLRWRKKIYKIIRSNGKKYLIIPADNPPLSENSILSQNSKNDPNDKTIAVYEKKDDIDRSEHYEEKNAHEQAMPDLDLERYMENVLERVHQRKRAREKELEILYKRLGRIFKRTNFEDFFRDPVASVVEVLEYVSWWMAHALSLPPPEPVDHDKLIYKREEKIFNYSIYIAALLIDNQVLFSYTRELNNNTYGMEPQLHVVQ